ncbi:MAG: response regulator transcription factor [Flavobacteriaceae bacterium]
MDKSIRVLIVEDDMIIAENLSVQLTKLGYDIVGIVSKGEEAISFAKDNTLDILLLDINLRGVLDGINTAKCIQKHRDIPIIYLTANSDEATFKKAKETRPKAFITKPFNRLNLERTFALVAEDLKISHSKPLLNLDYEVLVDRIFVRQQGKMKMVLLDTILYIEADRNYCTIVSDNNTFFLSCTLKTMEKKLPKRLFLRIHRSFIVNILKLDIISEGYLEIGRKIIPVAKSKKKLLLSRIQTV